MIPFFWKVFARRNVESTLGCLFVFSVVFSGISWVHAFVFLLYPSAILLDRVWSFVEYSILPVWKDGTGSFLKRGIHSMKGIFKNDKVSFCFAVGSVLILLCNRSIIGGVVEERLMMASYLLYFAVFQYVLLLFALKDEPAIRSKREYD